MTRVIYWAFYTFLISCFVFTWATSPQEQVSMRLVQEAYFRYGAMVLFSLLIGNIFFTLFFIYNLILFLINGFDIGASYTLNIFMAMVLYAVSKKVFERFSFTDFDKGFLILGIVNMVWMIMQRFGIDPLYAGSTQGLPAPTWDFRDTVGLFGIKAAQGIFYALLIPILARRSVLCSLFLFIPIWLSNSSAGIVAACAGLIFYTYYSKQSFILTFHYPIVQWYRLASFPSFGIRVLLIKIRWFIVLLAALTSLSIGYIAFKDYKASPGMLFSRFGVWHLALRQVLPNPLGFGPDSVRNFVGKKDFMFGGDDQFRTTVGVWTGEVNDEGKRKLQIFYYHPNLYKMRNEFKEVVSQSLHWWDNLHNEFLTATFQWGYFGVLLMILFLRELWLRFKNSDKTEEMLVISSCILVFLVSSLTQFPFHLARLGFLFPVLLGVFWIRTNKPKERKWKMS